MVEAAVSRARYGLLPVLFLSLTACQSLLPGARSAIPPVSVEMLPERVTTETLNPDLSVTGASPLFCPSPVVVEALPAAECPSPRDDPKHFNGKIVVGRSEYVYIEPGPLKLRARVDSGATTSSLHAADIVRFERDGESWVRFRTLADGDEKSVEMELPVSRRVRIRTKTEVVDRRQVVEVNLSLGDVTQRIEVTLVDRGEFDYPVLIGRNFLRDVAVIDVSRTFIHGR